MTAPFDLIIGLGNPGAEHAATRHNAGFWVVDELARRHGGRFDAERKFHGEVARITLAGHEVRLLKPMTYMNLSGKSAIALAQYMKVPTDRILVVHDEIDIPTGDLRLKVAGGHGGHNGLRDLHQQLGADYKRLRVGVGRPAHSSQVIDYVLTKPRKEEVPVLETAIARGADAVERAAAEGFEKAMTWLHTKTE